MENNENERIDQIMIGKSDFKGINVIFDACRSICKILYKNTVGTGFFIKIQKNNNNCYFIMSCEHVITKQMIDLKESIDISYDNQHKNLTIKLDKKERFIRDYRYLNIDSTVVEIFPNNDDINEIYFLESNPDYQKGYEQYENKTIY